MNMEEKKKVMNERIQKHISSLVADKKKMAEEFRQSKSVYQKDFLKSQGEKNRLEEVLVSLKRGKEVEKRRHLEEKKVLVRKLKDNEEVYKREKRRWERSNSALQTKYSQAISKFKLERKNLLHRFQNKFKRLEIKHEKELDGNKLVNLKRIKKIENMNNIITKLRETFQSRMEEGVEKVKDIFQTAKMEFQFKIETLERENGKKEKELRNLRLEMSSNTSKLEKEIKNLKDERRNMLKDLSSKDSITPKEEETIITNQPVKSKKEEDQEKPRVQEVVLNPETSSSLENIFNVSRVESHTRKGQLERRIMSQRKSLSNRMKQIQLLQTSIGIERKKFEDQIESLQKQHEIEIKLKDQAIEDLTLTLESEKRDQRNRVMEIRRKYNLLYNKSKTELEATINDLRCENDRKVEIILVLRSKVKSLGERVKLLKSEKLEIRTTLTLRIEMLRRKMNNRMLRKHELHQADVLKKNEEIETLTKDVENCEKRINEMTKNLSKSEKRKEVVSSRLRNAEGKLMKDETSYQSRIRELEKKNQSLEKDNVVLKQQGDKLIHSMEELRVEHLNLSRTHDDMVVQTGSKNREMKKLESQVKVKEREIRRLNEKLVEEKLAKGRDRSSLELEIQQNKVITGLRKEIQTLKEEGKKGNKIEEKELLHEIKLKEVKSKYNQLYMDKKKELEDKIKEITKNVKLSLSQLQDEMEEKERINSEKEEQMIREHDREIESLLREIERLKM